MYSKWLSSASRCSWPSSAAVRLIGGLEVLVAVVAWGRFGPYLFTA